MATNTFSWSNSWNGINPFYLLLFHVLHAMFFAKEQYNRLCTHSWIWLWALFMQFTYSITNCSHAIILFDINSLKNVFHHCWIWYLSITLTWIKISNLFYSVFSGRCTLYPKATPWLLMQKLASTFSAPCTSYTTSTDRDNMTLAMHKMQNRHIFHDWYYFFPKHGIQVKI